MLKEIKEYSQEERMQMILHGSDFATFVANEDIVNYTKFKSGDTEGLAEEDLRDISILAILEKLGYPMNELGTYLYKELIAEVYKNISEISITRRDMIKFRTMLTQLNDGFSQLYHNVAREYLDIGIKSFHLYVEKAIAKINPDVIDSDLVRKIFGDSPVPQTYGLQAFQIASYCLGLYEQKSENKISQVKPITRRLTNVPDDIVLKVSV